MLLARYEQPVAAFDSRSMFLPLLFTLILKDSESRAAST